MPIKPKKTKARAKVSQTKRAVIAKIHIAKKELGFDDDTYRDILRLATGGKTSCADMNLSELEKALVAMRVKGFKPKKASAGRKPNMPTRKQALTSKIEAMLSDMNLSWNYATGMAKRMFNKEAVEFLTDAELYKLTQALAVHQRRQAG